MGKRDYALKLYGTFQNVNDLAQNIVYNFSEGLVTNIHEGAKFLLMRGINPTEFFADRINILRHCVIVGDEICGGVVPVDSFKRKWRDETGKLYQYLANEAEIVDRVFAGLALRLKG